MFVTRNPYLHWEQITDFGDVGNHHDGPKVRADCVDCFDEPFTPVGILGAESFVDNQGLEAMAGAVCE